MVRRGGLAHDNTEAIRTNDTQRGPGPGQYRRVEAEGYIRRARGGGCCRRGGKRRREGRRKEQTDKIREPLTEVREKQKQHRLPSFSTKNKRLPSFYTLLT